MPEFERGEKVVIRGTSHNGRTGTYLGASLLSHFPHRVDMGGPIPYVFQDGEVAHLDPPTPLLYDAKHRVRISGDVPGWVKDDESLTEAYFKWLNEVVSAALNEAQRKIDQAVNNHDANIKVEVG